jgi:hypothetical protein
VIILPTQAIADFLATTANPPLDGILYPSVQVGYLASPFGILGRRKERRNVVLFHKACRVQPSGIPANAAISVEDDRLLSSITGAASDQPDINYIVYFGAWQK